MISAIQNGVQGLERASGLVNSASSKIAAPSNLPTKNATPSGKASGDDLPQNMVNLAVGHKIYDANAKVVEVAVRMLDEVV